MIKLFSSLDDFLEKAELRIGKVALSVLIGFVFLGIAMIISAVRFDLYHHGSAFSKLSQTPFDMSTANDLRYRILAPLFGYLLYFRGENFKYLMLIVLAIFIGLIYFSQRRKFNPSESLGLTAVCAFSTLTFYQLYFPAYTDPLSFLLIILLFIHYKKVVASTVLLFLMIFNHENTMFLFPFFFLLMIDANFSFRNIINVSFRFLVVIIPYIIYRKIISSYHPLDYTLDYYIDKNNIEWTVQHVLPNLASGIYQSFRFAWIFPVAALLINMIQKRYYEILLIVSGIGFVLLQLIVAHDISRLVGLVFPVILLSAWRTREFFGKEKFLSVLSLVLIINLLLPSWYIGALEPVSYRPEWLTNLFAQ